MKYTKIVKWQIRLTLQDIAIQYYHTDWVYVRDDDKEIARWDFTADQLPENEEREVTMQIAGFSIVAILGLINFLLVAFQLVTGLHLVKVGFGVHKKSGIALCCTALLHAVFAFI
jgi:hypothetical protein